MAEQQTSEDDRAELRLRALMAVLHNPDHPEFGKIRSFREGVPSHTVPAVERAIDIVAKRFCPPNGGIGVTLRTNTVLAQRVDESGRPDQRGSMWAEVIYFALVAADNGDIILGRFNEMWTTLLNRMG